MKKFLATLLVALMLVSLCVFQVSADAKVVYVGVGDPVWEEKGTGTKDDPYSKLSMAIKALSTTGGEIVLLSDIDLLYEYQNTSENAPAPASLTVGSSADTAFHYIDPLHTGAITIKSESADSIKNIKFTANRNNTSWTMNGPTTFKNVKLDFQSGTYKRFYTNGYDVVFGKGTTSYGTYLYPGIGNYVPAEEKFSRKVTSTTLVIEDGDWNYIFGPQATNCGDDLVINYYITGNANFVGYVAPAPMNKLSFKECNVYVDTTKSIGTFHNGYSAKNGTINVNLKNGTIGIFNVKPIGACENTKLNVNMLGGAITTFNNDATFTEFKLNVASGVTAPAVSGVTAGVAPSIDFTVKKSVAATPVIDAKATLKTTAEIKPNTDVVFTVDGVKEGAVAIFKKGYDFSNTDTETEETEETDYDPAFKYPILDEEGNIKVDSKGVEQYQQYVYGDPLMKGFVENGKVTLNKDSEGVIKKINDAEYAELAGLAVGEYVAYFYAPGATEATASVEFKVTENPKVEPSKPSVETGDEIVWIVLATIVSAMAAAVVYNKKRI